MLLILFHIKTTSLDAHHIILNVFGKVNDIGEIRWRISAFIKLKKLSESVFPVLQYGSCHLCHR